MNLPETTPALQRTGPVEREMQERFADILTLLLQFGRLRWNSERPGSRPVYWICRA
jgi:hypothetical protein